MAKILLVEDDKSLREIYAVRLQAEGYTIVTANDGEQALAVAIKEKPDLIITDVMMPKISGFDMLDIVRSTPETRAIKVIMMTALSSDDQRTRGEKIGADRYLVKSQVGIEDVVRTVHEVLGDAPAAPPVTPGTPPVPPTPPTTPPAPSAPQAPAQPADAVVAPPPVPTSPTSTPTAPSARSRVIQPINDPHAKIDISALLEKELAKEGTPTVASTAEERELINSQIKNATATPVATGPRPTTVAPQRAFDVTAPRTPAA